MSSRPAASTGLDKDWTGLTLDFRTGLDWTKLGVTGLDWTLMWSLDYTWTVQAYVYKHIYEHGPFYNVYVYVRLQTPSHRLSRS